MGLKSYFAEKCVIHEVGGACDLLSGGGLFSIAGLEVATMFVSWCLIYTLPMVVFWNLLLSKSIIQASIGKLCLLPVWLLSVVGVIVQVTLPTVMYFMELFVPSEDIWKLYHRIHNKIPEELFKFYLTPLSNLFDLIF